MYMYSVIKERLLADLQKVDGSTTMLDLTLTTSRQGIWVSWGLPFSLIHASWASQNNINNVDATVTA